MRLMNRPVLIGLSLLTAALAGCDVRVVGVPADVVVVGETVPPYYPSEPTYTYSDHGGRNPIIQSYTANPSNQVPQGQPITFQVVAYDPERDVLQFNWSATGGTLSTNSGQVVSWIPPAKAGVYTVMVTVANSRGGFVMGSLNLIVQSDGTTGVGGQPPVGASIPPSPTPAPVATAVPTTAPTATPVATTAPTATPAPTPTPVAQGKAAIFGVIKDDSGPLAGAEVILSGPDDYIAKVTTKEDGKYRFDDAPAGVQLVLQARKSGYGEKLRTISALGGTESNFDFDGTFALSRL